MDDDDEDDLDGWELESVTDGLDSAPSPPCLPADPRGVSPELVIDTSDFVEPVRTRTRRGKKRKTNGQHQSRGKERAKKRKADAERQEKDRQSADARHYVPSAHALQKIGDAEVLGTEFDVADLHAAKGGFIGKRLKVDSAVPELDALRNQGYELFEWDGRWVTGVFCGTGANMP